MQQKLLCKSIGQVRSLYGFFQCAEPPARDLVTRGLATKQSFIFIHSCFSLDDNFVLREERHKVDCTLALTDNITTSTLKLACFLRLILKQCPL